MSALMLKIGVLAATTWLTTSFTSITSSEKDAAGEQASPKGNFTLQLEGLWPLKSKISHWWESLIMSHFTLHYDTWVWVPKGPRKFEWITTYTESYIAWIGYCLMVYWILHQAHLKEVTLTQNWETMTIQNLTTLDFYNLSCGRAHMNRMVMKYHSAESPLDYVFILHLKARDHTYNHISPCTAFGWILRSLTVSWSWPLARV